MCPDQISKALELTEKASKKKEDKQNWYFTFGAGHGNRMFYVRINGTKTSTRERMVELFGTMWSFQYSEKGFKDQAEEWNYAMHPISLSNDAKVLWYERSLKNVSTW